MSLEWMLLVTLIASVLQAITGFGFGLLVLSVFLLVLGDVAAVQLVIVLTLGITLLHSFFLHQHIERRWLLILIFGSLLGFPIGLWLFEVVSLFYLKLTVALFLLIFSIQSLYQIRFSNEHSTDYSVPALFSIGALAGLMTSALGMPGPVLMIFMARSRLSKDQVRALLIVFMLFAYSIALALHAWMSGLRPAVLELSMQLLPAALLGVFIGQVLAKRVSKKLFRLLVLGLLLLTSMSLFYSLL